MSVTTVTVSGTCMSDHPPCTGYPHVGPIQWGNTGSVRDVRDQSAILGLQHRILILDHNIEMERRNREKAEGRALLANLDLARQLARALGRIDPAQRTPDDDRVIAAWSPVNPHGVTDADVERLRNRVEEAQRQATRYAAMGRLAGKPIDWDALAAQWAAEAGFENPALPPDPPPPPGRPARVWFALTGGPRGASRVGVYHAFDIPDVDAQERAEQRGPTKDMVAICGRKVPWFYMHHSKEERPKRYTCRRCFDRTIDEKAR